MGAIDDAGKEAEYRNLLLSINKTLHVLQPEMFKANEAYSYVRPAHFGY
jgi:hypothetical protein